MAGRQAPAPRREESQQGSMIRTVAQTVGIFMLVQFAMKSLLSGQNASQQSGSGTKGSSAGIPAFSDRPMTFAPDVQYNQIPQMISPIWPKNIPLDLSIYVSPSMVMPSLDKMPKNSLVVQEKSFGYGDFKDKRVVDTTIKVPEEVQRESTLWAHIYIAQAGAQMDPLAHNYDPSKAFNFNRPFTSWLVKKKERKTRSLLGGKNASETAEEEPEATPSGPQYGSFYHPNFTLSFIPDAGVQNYPHMHPALKQFVQLERSGARDASGQNGWFYPIVYVNTFWQLRDHMTQINTTVKELPLRIDLNNMAQWQWSIMASVDEGMKSTREKAARGESVGPAGDGAELEEFKKILLDSNPYLLATTFCVSVLHMIFEMLAFKSDVSHWRNKKDNIGTSVRTIIANVVMQTIIFLYLFDNNENTSWMILFSQGMGIAIEAWKITKTANIRVRQTAPGSFLPYAIVLEDKHKLSDVEKKTEEYDQIAFRYMYYIAIPLLIAYAAYSLIYDTHKSWYSFIITTLVGSVYAYGFLLMVPSLYINYRLKSVAHMPAKAMMYKFLNTFIDDLFAFTIKMPLLHRLATLRDDVIFFVYLYQSYKYKIDYARVNEFGQGGDEDEKQDEDAEKKEEADETKNAAKIAALPEGNVDKARIVDDIKGSKSSGVETGGQAKKRKA